MKRIALAAVAVVALMGTLTATAAPESNSTTQSTHHHIAPPPSCTVAMFRPFSAKVWRLDHWDRGHHGEPGSAALTAAHRRIACAGPGNRVAMEATWARDKHAFYRHRSKKLANLRYLEAIDPPGAAVLAAIRECESGGNYAINTGNGFYGAYQFTLDAWASVGGSGYPSAASPREQDERAAALYRASGPGPWPVCGV